MFEKTLTDVVRGIRASKRDTALYISQCIAEIKTEINSADMFVKANALQKLTFLQMMGYSMSWASFATIEVMSSPRFAHKRIGYLAASQGFTQDTEVILLTTNSLKKELRGAVGGSMRGVYEAGLAVNCVSNIVTEDLARDLLPELTNLTSHPQPYLRKKAILCLFKVFVKYPQGLRLTFQRLQQCLNDPNASVVSCAVNVITELSDKNPKNYLGLAPAFFGLLTTSSNNWMLIKVVKLLGSLVPEEPRLARKLLEPLANIVRNTQAKSLLYEAVHTITLCLPYCRKSDGSMPPVVPEIVVLCAQTLRGFVEETDQNLKYLGLVGFGSLMQSHPKVLIAPDYRPLILACLSDQDVTIRTRALDLLPGMASRKNLVELVSQLLSHVEAASGAYKLGLVAKIVEMCSGEKYSLLQDFGWYLDILFRLGRTRGVDAHAGMLRAQIADVALRVLPVRAYAVRRCIGILLLRAEDGCLSGEDDPYGGDNGRGKDLMPEILPSVAWIVGEYSDLIREALSLEGDPIGLNGNNSRGYHHAIVQALTSISNTQKLPTDTQKVFVHAAMKVFAAATAEKAVKGSEVEACVETIQSNLPVYVQSNDVEVVETSFLALELLKSFDLMAGRLNGAANFDSAAADDDDSSEEGPSEDLLGMGGTADAPKEPVKPKSAPRRPSSLTARCRHASSALNHLLKPSPMKPIGTKAQRKKRQSPPAGASVGLDSAVDLSVFQWLIEEEVVYQAGSKLNMEAVCFTQQRPLKPEEPTSIASSAAPSVGVPPMPGSPPPFASSKQASSSSFQNSAGGVVTGAVPRQRQSDPFYLDSQNNEGNDVPRDHPSRFGTIQLLDSDEEEAAAGKKHKKKKHKKPKRSRSRDSSSQVFSDAGLASVGQSSTASFLPGTAKAAVTVYESDDDDDEEEEEAAGNLVGRKKGPGNEFASLAKVDLTTPLRDDEVMPERKHRVVPARQPDERKPPASEKKQKPKKKKKKKKTSLQAPENGVGDLLDLSVFGEAPKAATSTPPIPETKPASLQQQSLPSAFPPATSSGDSNLISSAFSDDLLGLATPAPAPQLGIDSLQPSPSPLVASAPPTSASAPKTSKKSGKRPWSKATVKQSNASGPGTVDWSSVSLLFRVYRTTHGDGPAAMLAFRVDNVLLSDLNGVTLEFKDMPSVEFGSIPSKGTVESGKVGPFVCPEVDTSRDFKGTLKSQGSSVSVKITVPSTLHLTADENLSIDHVAAELSSSQWSSHSAKVPIGPGVTLDDVKTPLVGFLRAAEVHQSERDPTTSTFASRSASGARVRLLVKAKESALKVDVKSTSAILGKSLASDVKRLVL